MQIFQLSKKFPVEERYSKTFPDSSLQNVLYARILLRLGVSDDYVAAFVAKLNDCEAEAAETQTWIEFAVKCNYMDVEVGP